jgi:hypothetical protein
MRCPWLILCSALADLFRCPSQTCHWCSFDLMSMEWAVCPMWTLPHSQEILQTPSVLNLRLSLSGWRRLHHFIWGKAKDLMMCQARTLLIQFNTVLTKGRKGDYCLSKSWKPLFGSLKTFVTWPRSTWWHGALSLTPALFAVNSPSLAPKLWNLSL